MGIVVQLETTSGSATPQPVEKQTKQAHTAMREKKQNKNIAKIKTTRTTLRQSELIDDCHTNSTVLSVSKTEIITALHCASWTDASCEGHPSFKDTRV